MVDIAKFVADLRGWEGVPYHHQGRSVHGVDCVGLAIVALAQQGIDVPSPANYSRSSNGDALLEMIEASGLVQRLPDGSADMQPGDILAFRIRTDPTHVAVALGGGDMIHADANNGVRIVTLSPLWVMRLVAFYRFEAWT